MLPGLLHSKCPCLPLGTLTERSMTSLALSWTEMVSSYVATSSLLRGVLIFTAPGKPKRLGLELCTLLRPGQVGQHQLLNPPCSLSCLSKG